MDIQPDKTKQKEAKEQLKTLEREIKMAFKGGQFESVRAGAKSIQTLDPENHLAEKLIRKTEILEQKEEIKAKAGKIKEYELTLKKLLKDRDVTRLKELAAEFSHFDPENRSARGWIQKAEKLEAKLGTKKEVKPIFTKEIQKEAPKANIEIRKQETEAPKPAPTGNIFTKMFGKKEEETQKKSIIDTIVAKGEKKEAEPVKPAKPKDASNLLAFAKIFMNFAIIFIVFSAAFLYVEWIDKENTLLGMAGISENTGSRLHNAAEEIDALKKEEATLNKDIELYKGGYDDKTFRTVGGIINQRINWPDIFAKINEVTNSVYELNDFFKYIEYNNYSFDAENGTIRVTGTLSDPLGRNLTKLVELENAFKYYPKDQNNPDDPTKPYFTGFKEFTSFSKTLDETTGRYTSNFQLSFVLNK